MRQLLRDLTAQRAEHFHQNVGVLVQELSMLWVVDRPFDFRGASGQVDEPTPANLTGRS